MKWKLLLCLIVSAISLNAICGLGIREYIKLIREMMKGQQLLIEINHHKRKTLIEQIKIYEKQKEYMLIKFKVKEV